MQVGTLGVNHDSRNFLGCAHQVAYKGQAGMAIGNDANGIASRWILRDACCQRWIITQHSANTTKNARQFTTQIMHTQSCLFARHPFAVTPAGADLAIKCHGIFHHNPRHTRGDILQEDTILIAQLLLKTICHLHFDTGSHQLFDALTGNKRIRVAQTHNHSTDVMFDDGIGARRLMAMMTTRLKGHIHRRTLAIHSTPGCILKRISFGMQIAITLVITLGNDFSIAHNECTHKRIGIYCALALLSECHGFAHQHNIVGCYHIIVTNG